MPELKPDDFVAFYTEVHGHAPFPWQKALLQRVATTGWPELIDVPTGLGKTSVIDVAVFAAALGCPHARRRIFFVVDRRLVVDEAYEHASCISRALSRNETGPVTRRVAAALRLDDADEDVLETTRMRGGVDWSWNWLERPDRHAVVVGTVDQVGSRLFFRGYGVGQRLRPIDAALTGTDSLIVVDEAHLSESFLHSAADAVELDRTPVDALPILVAMSASPGSATAELHTITERDEAEPEARKRLRADKQVHLVEVKTTKKNTREVMSGALAEWARALGGDGRLIGVVCNTVAMARAVFDRLRTDSPTSCVLLTGRIRPIDRDYLLAEWYDRLRAGRQADSAGPLYLVATQTIEVGANIDLDGLVTETPSLPALIQRLGRLNRLGTRDPADAVVLHGTADLDPKKAATDGVYGPARLATWTWLSARVEPYNHRSGALPQLDEPGLDASPGALRTLVKALDPTTWTTLRGTSPYTPVLTEGVLAAWARTAPEPYPDPPIEPYLHGISGGSKQVSVVWRAGLNLADKESCTAALTALPPTADEAIELPLVAVRRWLTGAAHADALSDLDGDRPADDGTADTPLRVLRYGPNGRSAPVLPQQIRPDDLIVVPADFGGCDRYGWNPDSADPVVDVADLTLRGGRGRRRAGVRLGPILITALTAYAPDLAEPVSKLLDHVTADLTEGNTRAAFQELSACADPAFPHHAVLAALGRQGRLLPYSDGEQLLFVSAVSGFEEDESPAGSSATGKKITLSAHQQAVRLRAEEFARNLELPEILIRSAGLAAELHDEGKRDERFQAMLHDGDHWAALAATEPIAKSGMNPADRAAFTRAWHRSGYPAKMRHESLSARIAAHKLAGRDDIDPELVLHLVASHHGHSRPLLPPVTDPAPVKVTVDGHTFDSSETVDWSAPGRFENLNQRYGRWGLARLEAIVRLADIWCSAHDIDEEP